MSNERILVFNYNGTIAGLREALDKAIEEAEKEEPEKLTLASMYGTFSNPEPEENHDCENCPDKEQCKEEKKALLNMLYGTKFIESDYPKIIIGGLADSSEFGEYLKSIFDPRD